MALPRAIVYHALWFDIRNFAATFLRPRVAPTPAAESRVELLENEFARNMNAKFAVAFPFARSAIYFALKNRDFPPGSEIIMPPITIKPMMDMVLSLKLKPVFVDIERNTLCFDIAKLEQAISGRTRAVLLTYLFGIVPDVEKLVAACRRRGLFVVEDFSHALNAEQNGRKLGTFGDVGVYSCSATKTLDAYGGALAVTDDEGIHRGLRDAKGSLKPTGVGRLRTKIQRSVVWNLATRRLVWTLATFPFIRLLRRYNPVMEQQVTGARLGLQPTPYLPEECFERFTQRQAEAGLALLPMVEPQDRKRIANVEAIKSALNGQAAAFPGCGPGGRNVYWQFAVYVRDKDEAQRALAKRGIDTGTTNLSLVSGLGIYPEHESSCPNAEYVKTHAVFIPAYPRLSPRGLRHVIASLKAVLDSGR